MIGFKSYKDYFEKEDSDLILEERRDCVVKSLTILTEADYDHVHEFCKLNLNRDAGCGTETDLIYKKFAIFKRVGFFINGKHYSANVRKPYTIKRDKEGNLKKTKISLKDFALNHRRGNYMVLCSGHALALKNGIYYDDPEFYHKMNRKVLGYIKIDKL